jgi:hypothetical protein
MDINTDNKEPIEVKNITRKYNYYAGTANVDTRVLLLSNGDMTGEDYGTIWEGTEAEAQLIINNLEEGAYRLSHGESGRPTYAIITG